MFRKAQEEMMYKVLCGTAMPSDYFYWLCFHSPTVVPLDTIEALRIVSRRGNEAAQADTTKAV